MNDLNQLTTDGAPRRVLVVDDHPRVAASIGRMLQRSGCRIRIASSAGEAIAAFRDLQLGDERFDLVITDFSMIDESGLAVAAAVKAMSPSTPVVLMSAGLVDPRDDLPRHVDAVMTKPPTTAELSILLARLRREPRD
jgi:CheY-like chemotaxis protein